VVDSVLPETVPDPIAVAGAEQVVANWSTKVTCLTPDGSGELTSSISLLPSSSIALQEPVNASDAAVAIAVNAKSETSAAIGSAARWKLIRLPKLKVNQLCAYAETVNNGARRRGQPRDLFVWISPRRARPSLVMNSIMISVSLGLQYSVPLEVYVAGCS
jgi:hypothetical protein